MKNFKKIFCIVFALTVVSCAKDETTAVLYDEMTQLRSSNSLHVSMLLSNQSAMVVDVATCKVIGKDNGKIVIQLKTAAGLTSTYIVLSAIVTQSNDDLRFIKNPETSSSTTYLNLSKVEISLVENQIYASLDQATPIVISHAIGDELDSL